MAECTPSRRQYNNNSPPVPIATTTVDDLVVSFLVVATGSYSWCTDDLFIRNSSMYVSDTNSFHPTQYVWRNKCHRLLLQQRILASCQCRSSIQIGESFYRPRFGTVGTSTDYQYDKSDVRRTESGRNSRVKTATINKRDPTGYPTYAVSSNQQYKVPVSPLIVVLLQQRNTKKSHYNIVKWTLPLN